MFAKDLRFALNTALFFTNKTCHDDIAEILLKMILNTCIHSYNPFFSSIYRNKRLSPWKTWMKK
jgi:hypothetical protein